MRNIFKDILDFLFPRAEREILLDSITAADLASCEKSDPLEERDWFALFSYRDPRIQELIWSLKYRGRRKSAKLLAEILHDFLIETLSEQIQFGSLHNPILIPIPLSKKRLRERGFNQALWILEELNRLNQGGIPSIERDALARIKHTESQTVQKGRKSREENLRGAFAVVLPEAVSGRTVILVDDVITTGSTMREAERTLLTAGARNVVCIAIAH